MGELTNFTYDALTSGYDTGFWKAVLGTPVAAGGLLTLPCTSGSPCEISTYSSFLGGEAEFGLTLPTAPAADDYRAFGFANPSFGNRSRAEFEVSGIVFACKVYDRAGNVLLNAPVAWNAAWTNAQVRYAVRWQKTGVTFLINNVAVATLNLTDTDAEAVGVDEPVSAHVKNGKTGTGNADTLSVASVSFRNVVSFT